jgi:hypothetical protein
VDTGRAPGLDTVARWLGDTSDGQSVARTSLRELHAAHMIVLDDVVAADTIRMALPFSAVATDYVVEALPRSWWANCAWDALAIPAALEIDARIDARWFDTGQPVDIVVEQRRLSDVDGFVHFAVPARHWWDDIVET